MDRTKKYVMTKSNKSDIIELMADHLPTELNNKYEYLCRRHISNPHRTYNDHIIDVLKEAEDTISIPDEIIDNMLILNIPIDHSGFTVYGEEDTPVCLVIGKDLKIVDLRHRGYDGELAESEIDVVREFISPIQYIKKDK